tara:strand:- start:122 stop:310 length:189 start_codon:yes stop_codon:yes gene_type:complete
MVDYFFYLCVDILAWIAQVTGTTYELVNVIIFVIGYPLFVIFLLSIIYFQSREIKKLRNNVN